MICEGLIRDRLEQKDVKIKIFDVIDSTNSEAKRMVLLNAEQGEHVRALIVAREQTLGRGRMGRDFFSRAGGIYMSLVYATDAPIGDAVSITTAAAAVVAQAIEDVSGAPMRIKWVNDIYNDKGKVSGILTEAVALGGKTAIIVGVGINIGEVDFPEELSGIASSVGEIDGKESLLIAKIADGLLRCADAPLDRSYMVEYRKRFMLDGKSVDLIRGGERVCGGVVVGVNDDGGLLLLPDKEADVITVQSGEISVREAKR